MRTRLQLAILETLTRIFERNQKSDDTLVFRTTLLGEYALLLAERPLGLGLSEDVIKRLAEQSIESRFLGGGKRTASG